MEPTDCQPVLIGHLHQLIETLDSAYSLVAALDIQRAALNTQANRPSRLANRLRTELDRFQAYATDGENLLEENEDVVS